jgi:hypothetical protein
MWYSVSYSQQQPRQVLRLCELSEVPTDYWPVADLVLAKACFRRGFQITHSFYGICRGNFGARIAVDAAAAFPFKPAFV